MDAGPVTERETPVRPLVRAHCDKRSGKRGLGDPKKTPVLRDLCSARETSSLASSPTSRATLVSFVREAVSTKVSLPCSDDYAAYGKLDKDFPHAVVDHSAGQHVVGAVHTQAIDSFWSLIKRGVMGSFHKVSRKYLSLYVGEFQFRYNNRGDVDIFGIAIRQC
jgi:hypothetical protein